MKAVKIAVVLVGLLIVTFATAVVAHADATVPEPGHKAQRDWRGYWYDESTLPASAPKAQRDWRGFWYDSTMQLPAPFAAAARSDPLPAYAQHRQWQLESEGRPYDGAARAELPGVICTMQSAQAQRICKNEFAVP